MYKTLRTSPPPDTKRRPRGPTVLIKWHYTDQCCHLPAVELAEFGDCSDERTRQDLADAWHQRHQVFLVAPHRALADGAIEILVELFDLRSQPLDVLLEAFAHLDRARHPQTISFRCEYFDELPTTS